MSQGARVSECQLPNIHCGYPDCVREGHCVEDREHVLNQKPSDPPEADRWQKLYLDLRQQIENIAFPPGDPRRGARTEAELLSELKRCHVRNPVGKR